MDKKIWILFLLCFFYSGCTTANKKFSTSSNEKQASEHVLKKGGDAESLKLVVGAISGKEVSRDDLKNVAKQVKKDPEARTAVESITQTMGGNVEIKYCPVCGKRYSSKFEKCPKHGVLLKAVE